MTLAVTLLIGCQIFNFLSLVSLVKSVMAHKLCTFFFLGPQLPLSAIYRLVVSRSSKG
jgi:hypothetical protein